MGPSNSEQRARAALQEHGLRATEQRIVVLEALMSRSSDVTPQSLFDELRSNHPTIGIATVYRTLAALAEAGVVDALQHGHGTCYRFCAPGHHHHLVCSDCHRVIELHDCAVGAWADSVAKQHGFSDVRHVVELTGTCAECRAA